MVGENNLKPSMHGDFLSGGWRRFLRTLSTVVCVSLVATLMLAPNGAAVPVGNLSDCTPRPPLRDDFNGPAGAPPNPQLWKYLLGAGGDNGELEAYTDSPRNASLDGNGNLAVTARREPYSYPGFPEMPYTSAWLETHGRLDFCYGTISARIKLPAGKGLRPAFWMLGSDFGTVGWPQCGEIDIIELPYGATSIHNREYVSSQFLPFDVGTEWHEYALDLRPNRITSLVDGKAVAGWTPNLLPPEESWMFNGHPMYVILNMSVSGPWEQPDASTPAEATMLVDWVHYTP